MLIDIGLVVNNVLTILISTSIIKAYDYVRKRKEVEKIVQDYLLKNFSPNNK